MKTKAPRIFVDQAAFRAAFRDGKCPALRSYFPGVELKADGDSDKFSFVMSTADVDRMGDTIHQDGWDTGNFVKNPVMQWAHNYGLPPVGKVGRTLVENGKLIARDVEFQLRDVYEFGWSVGQMYLQKFLNAVSVGFQPTVLEWKDDESGGIEFQKQELLEVSAVPVPANPHALQLAKSAGLMVPAWKGWAESILDDETMRADKGNPLTRSAFDVYELMSPVAVSVAKTDEPDEPMPEMVDLAVALRENTAEVRAFTAELRAVRNTKSSDDAASRIAARTLSLLKP